MFKFVVDSPTKKPREARFLFYLEQCTVNAILHTESEACQKQCQFTQTILMKSLYLLVRSDQ